MRGWMLLALVACNGDKDETAPDGAADGQTDTDGDADTDADADSDADTDTDTDTDTDADADTDADTDPPNQCPELSIAAAPGTEFGTTVGWTDDYAEACGGAGFADVTVEVGIPADGHYVFAIDSFDFEPAITLFDACGGTALACGTGLVEADLPAGTVIAVIDGASGVDGGFALDVFEGGTTQPEALCGDAIDNDLDGASDCDDLDCGAEPACLPGCADHGVVGVPAEYVGSTVGADDTVTCIGSFGVPDEAIVWTAPSDGTFVFSLFAEFDSTMEVWVGGCDGGSGACYDQPDDSGESSHVTLSAGEPVKIDVDGIAPGDEGDYRLVITEATATEVDCADGIDDDADNAADCADSDCDAVCPEDCTNGVDDDDDGFLDCADSVCAQDPVCGFTCPNLEITDVLTGSTTGSIDGWVSSCGGSFAADVSASFTAPADGTYRFALVGSGTGFDSVLSVYDGCGGPELGCNDAWSPFAPNGGEEVVVDLIAGQVAIAVVDGFFADGAYELVVHEVTATELACGDGLDNDLDGGNDCADDDCAADAACSGLAHIDWSNEVTIGYSCFTFSSPTLLGTSLLYADNGGAASLDFVAPSWDAVFSGTWSGNALSATSVALFPYGLGEWQTTETMEGTLSGSTVTGSYHYTECDYTFDPASCPADGGCEVTADFAFDLP